MQVGWPPAVPQELQALIGYIQHNKEGDTDWFTIQPSDGGKHWSGKCWCVFCVCMGCDADGDACRGVPARACRACLLSR